MVPEHKREYNRGVILQPSADEGRVNAGTKQDNRGVDSPGAEHDMISFEL
jgi:hypothetical protein